MMKTRLVLAFLSLHTLVLHAADEPAETPVDKTTAAKADVLPSADEPLLKALSLPKAAASLDRTALAWVQKHQCGSCHTGWTYLAARAALPEPPGDALTQVRAFFKKRITHWDADEAEKKHQHREIVGTAAALAMQDALGGSGKLHPVTREALDRMWTLQRKDGAWNWPKCRWPPFEVDDYYGALLAAVGVGHAPEEYARGDSAKAGLAKLRTYLTQTPVPNAHHRAWLLWASTRLEGLLDESAQKQIIAELRALQRADGGWSMDALGPDWTGRKGAPADPDAPSDGYGTGLVVHVLREAGVPLQDDATRRGLAWLRANQRESGRWFTRSMNGVPQHYISDTATVFAVLALKGSEQDEEIGRIIVPATEEFPRNGESSMVVLQDGTILQLYGAMNGTGDWAISVMREIRSTDGGKTWSEPRTLFADPERSLFQPSLTRMANGEIGLTYTSLLPKRGAFKLFRRSTDEGQTWSEPIKISAPSLPHTTGPWDKFYTLQSGRVITLLHALLADDITKNTGPRGTYAMFSDDHGHTWQRAPREGTLRVEDEPHDKQEWGFWEPSLVEHAPGKLYLMARTSTGWLYECRSEDNGETWTEPVRTAVPNPIAPPVLTKIPGTDTLLLLHNPRVALGTERLGGHRTILAYRTSQDAGKTWSEPKTILEGKDGELWHDYPAILWHEGKLHLATRHIEIFNTNKWTKVSLRHHVRDSAFFR